MSPGAVLQPERTDPLIPPHGGVLVNRVAAGAARDEQLREARHLPALELSERAVSDLECIASGVYSPLQGFLGEADYLSVVDRMRLAGGLPWSIPVTLGAGAAFALAMRPDVRIALTHGGRVLATMKVESVYRPDKGREAVEVYRTEDGAHPGVAALYKAGEVNLGGPVTLLEPVQHELFCEFRLTPLQTRAEFAARGWRTIVAFQTRNPIHRAHEYLQKIALENVDGLFVNPLVGATKGDDVPAQVRMRTYQVILESYYPRDRVLLGVFPAAMRYAGPREAIMHAIARKNYGCTHFIVGRDHAGVGSYYGPYDAQRIFEEFAPGEMGIVPLKFENAHFCRKCGQFATTKTCPHESADWLQLSGTRVRSMLAAGEMPPPEFTRPEVARILMEAYREGNAK
ncbi:MAG TPA: sulfate adenylyltransferase [Bryobacteraceae bacterium]|nr:sulfate adenylyltransferase [Bryobacteraceae bacterium]